MFKVYAEPYSRGGAGSGGPARGQGDVYRRTGTSLLGGNARTRGRPAPISQVRR